MSHGKLALCLSFIPVLFFFSCAGIPETPETMPAPEEAKIEAFPETAKPEKPEAEKPEIPQVPEKIMGEGLTAAEKLTLFLLEANPAADREFTENLARFYVEEAAIEGINHDTAFAQMCLETGFLKFGGLVMPDMNNFCGLGATGPGNPGASFPDPRTGVRAHIQHLKAYASGEPLKQDLVDPRYHLVRPGSSPMISGLAGTWAADKQYAVKIDGILKRLYNFSFTDMTPLGKKEDKEDSEEDL